VKVVNSRREIDPPYPPILRGLNSPTSELKSKCEPIRSFCLQQRHLDRNYLRSEKKARRAKESAHMARPTMRRQVPEGGKSKRGRQRES